MYGLFDGWAMIDFHGAARYAESRPRSEARDKFRELLMQRAMATGGVAAAQQWVQGIPDDEHNQIYKQRAFDDVIQTMLYRDPSAAAHWVVQNAGQAFLGGKAVAETAARLAETAPLETLNWLHSLPGVTESQLAAGATKVTWSKQDPRDAGNWLGQNRQHPAYDRMAAQYARAIAGEHPQVALTWAQTIGNENVRAGTELANGLRERNNSLRQPMLVIMHPRAWQRASGRGSQRNVGYWVECRIRLWTPIMIGCPGKND